MKYTSKFIICLIFLLIFRKIYSYPNIDKNFLNLIYDFLEHNRNVEALNDLAFTKYFYSQNLSDASKIERNMPIYNFTECFNMIKDNNNGIQDIFISLIEFNNQKYANEQFTKPINTTIFQFFTDSGFLDYSICNNMEIKVSKKVETSKMDLQDIIDIEQKYNISFFKNETNFIDYCSPLNINNKDLTVYDRQMLLFKNEPCDNGCSFLNFNYTINYSTCLCKIHDEDEDIDLLNDIIKDNEYIEKFYQLIDKGNWKYFKCYKQAFIIQNKNEKHNWIRYISLVLILFVILFQILYYNSVKTIFPFDKNNSKKIEKTDKNLNNLNKIFTIQIQNEDDKSNSQNTYINFNKTFEIYNKSINELSDGKDNDSDSKDIKKKSFKNSNIGDNDYIESNQDKLNYSDDVNNESEDNKNEIIKNSNIGDNKYIESNQDKFNYSDDKDNDCKDNKKNIAKNSKVKHNNYMISSRINLDNLNEKDDNDEDNKNKIIQNSNDMHYNYILSTHDELCNLDDKDDNNEENKKKHNITFNQKIKFQKLYNIDDNSNRKLSKPNIFSRRNKNKSLKEKNNKSKKNKIHKSDIISNDNFEINNKDLKENSEIQKSEGISDESIKTNNKNLNFKYQIIYFLTFIDLDQDLASLYNAIIIYILSIHNLFFYNALLFSDKTISKRYYLKYKHDIKYLLTKEYDRILLVFFICKIINAIFISLYECSKDSLDLAIIIENKMNYNNEKQIFIIDQKDITKDFIQYRIKNSNENESEKKNDLIKTYKLIMIFFHILITLFHLIYFYFFMIFGNVNPNIQLSLLLSSLLSFVIYILSNLFFYAIKTTIKERIVKENNYFLKCLYKLKNNF